MVPQIHMMAHLFRWLRDTNRNIKYDQCHLEENDIGKVAKMAPNRHARTMATRVMEQVRLLRRTELSSVEKQCIAHMTSWGVFGMFGRMLLQEARLSQYFFGTVVRMLFCVRMFSMFLLYLWSHVVS